MAAFYTDGYVVSRRLDWFRSRLVEALGIELDFFRIGAMPEAIEPLRKAFRSEIGRLNFIRQEIAEGLLRQNAVSQNS